MTHATTSREPGLREALVSAGRRLARRRLIAAGEGNLSIRLPDGRLLVTPTGRRKDELSPADLVLVHADGTVEGAAPDQRPTSDLALHLAVYAARPDALAYVHAHLVSAMTLTLAGERPDPAALPETALLVPRLPVVPFAPPGSDQLAASVAAALSHGPVPLPDTVLLERHGAVAIGGGPGADQAASLATAVDRLELVDVLCRTWLEAMLLRAARTTLGR